MSQLTTTDYLSVHSYNSILKVDALVRFMQEEGVSANEILAGTDINRADLSAPDSHVSMLQLVQVMANMRSNSNDPTLALRAGQQFRVSNYGIYGFAMLSSLTLEDALRFAIKYHRLATPTVDMDLQVMGSGSQFSFVNKLAPEELKEFNLEMQLSLVHSLLKDMTASDFHSTEAMVAYDKPKHGDEYQRVLNCPVRFNAQATALCFDTSLLKQPLPQGNLVTSRMMVELCDKALQDIHSASSFVGKVQRLMMSHKISIQNAEWLATELNMTSRTLRRKLETLGTNYRELAISVRSILAIEYLSSAMTTEEIAERIGYSDAAAFRHAFKRWTGQPPNSYRKQL